MLSNQENKNIAISSLITISIFFALFLASYQSYKNSNIYILNFFKYLPEQINLIFIYIVLPVLIFVFLQKILLKYINFLWATSISALSIFSYAGYDFKEFIFELFFNFSDLSEITQKKIILLENPNISFAVLIFLVITFFCLKINRFNFNQIATITIAWSFFSFYSFSGSITGLIFWTIYSSIRIFRLKKSSLSALITGISSSVFFVFFILAFNNFISIEGYSVENIYNISLIYFLFYFVGPVLLILSIYFFYKIDFYEIFVKFMPIYVLMFSDLIASIYLANYKDNYQTHEYFVYPHFILHFLYIIPIIYYLSKPLSPFIENKKNKINSLKKYIFIFFNRMNKIYLPMMILLLILFLVIPGKFIL